MTPENRLTHIVRSSPKLMELLSAARELALPSWCIGAGAVRSLVWDALHGFSAPRQLEDVDVAYFDNTAGPDQERELTIRLTDAYPSVRWEVTNQALVHQWYLTEHGEVVPPLRSLAEGIATWPEYATCVGVTLKKDDSIEVIAPHGLADLLELRVRHNPIRASAAMFTERVKSKRFAGRWPMLSIIPVEAHFD